MTKSTEMRVPFGEILGVPSFLTGAAKEEWCKANKVVIEIDWAGRESVDLPTAWRLKEMGDKLAERANEERWKQILHNDAINTAQGERERLFGEAYQRIVQNAVGVNPVEAIAQARSEVDELEKDLPRDVRHRLVWPNNIPLLFNR